MSGFCGNKFIKSSTEAISKLSQEIPQKVEAEFYTFIDFVFFWTTLVSLTPEVL